MKSGSPGFAGVVAFTALASFALGARCAVAQSDEIQVYDGTLAAPGQFTLTLHNNYTPQGRRMPDFPDGVVPMHALNGVPEWAYGVTAWLEVGAYLPVYTRTASGQLLFDGAKLRALFAAPGAGDRRWFYGLNFEFSYNAAHWDLHTYSAELRPIIGVHLGRFTLVANPILDTGLDGFGNLDFAPCIRLAYAASARWTVAVEDYAEFGPLSHLRSGSSQPNSVFAAVDYERAGGGVEFGVGTGLNQASDDLVIKLMLNHDL